MPVVLRPRLLLSTTLVALAVALLPSVAAAQSDDPCLASLDPAGVEQYEQLVDTYYVAQEEGDFDSQLTALDSLAALCDANLRLGVLRGDALIGLDRCEDAADEYFRVLDAVPDWPHPDNAADARFMATESLRGIRDQCVAQVEVTCSPASAMVAIGTRTPEPCGGVFAVPARTTTVSAYADGHETVTREFTPRVGNNFVDLGTLPGGESTPPPVTDTTPDPQPAAAGADEGTLMVSCAPADATVRIEGPALAQPRALPCPVSTPLPEGAYTVTVEAANHDSTTREINVQRADVSRMAVELQQPGADKIGITLRLLGGVAFGSTNEIEVDAEGNETGDAASRRHGNLRVAVMSGMGGQGQGAAEFEFGAWLRTLFPFEDAGNALFAGAGTASYVLRLGVVGILLGGHLGYGHIGSYDDNADDDEEYAAGFIYGFGGGIHVPIGASLEILATVDLLLGTDSNNNGDLPLALDILGGVGWRF